MRRLESLRTSCKNSKHFTTMLISTRTVLFLSAKQNVSANQSDYEADKTSFQNVLSSQRNLWEIEAAYHQHLTDYQIALAELESLVGSNLRFFGGVPEGLSK